MARSRGIRACRSQGVNGPFTVAGMVDCGRKLAGNTVWEERKERTRGGLVAGDSTRRRTGYPSRMEAAVPAVLGFGWDYSADR